MAAVAAASAVSVPSVAVSAGLEKSTFSGSSLPSLALSKTPVSRKSLQIVASSKKTVTKTPNGPSGDSNFKADASGSKAKGKGTYQFTKKYGANVDGYSPIFTPNEWSSRGGTYEGGATGIALWAVTFGALLVLGVLLVYNTSSLA